MFPVHSLTVQCIYPKVSKPIIDEIDAVLARHYGSTDEELDFIISNTASAAMRKARSSTLCLKVKVPSAQFVPVRR